MEILLAVATVAALWVTLGKWMRRLMAYPTLTDVLGSAYFISTYATTGTVSGLTIAVISALFLSVFIRFYRKYFGYEQLIIDGETALHKVAAKVISQGIKWFNATSYSLIRNTEILAPEPLYITWQSM